MKASQEFAIICKAVLETLVECKADKHNKCIASTIYLGLNCNMELYENVVTVLSRLGWIERTSTQIWATELGFEVINTKPKTVEQKARE